MSVSADAGASVPAIGLIRGSDWVLALPLLERILV